MQNLMNYKKVFGFESHFQHLFLFAFLVKVHDGCLFWGMCETTNNFLCINHFSFFSSFALSFLFYKNFIKVAMVEENKGFIFVVTINNQLCFWSLILEFCCSLCFSVSLVLYLVASFAQRYICEAKRGEILSTFLLLTIVLSIHLLHQVLPSHKIKLFLFYISSC
jgi:hypothetical protein